MKLSDWSELPVHEQKAELKKLSYEVDEHIYKCHSLIAKHSVYFSQASLEALLAFTDNLLGGDFESEDTDLMDWIGVYQSRQSELADNAVTRLREELQLEKLHHSLYSRSKK